MQRIWQWALASVAALVMYAFGGWSPVLTVLCAVIIIDYLTGVMASAGEGDLSSSIGFKGIQRKVMILIMVAVAHLVDTALGTAHVFRDAVVFFYIANEILSITENSIRLGLPIPNALKTAITMLQGKSEPEEPGGKANDHTA